VFLFLEKQFKTSDVSFTWWSCSYYIVTYGIDDGRKLFRDFGILARNLVELGGVARQADPDFVRAFGSNRSMVSLAKVSKFSTEGISFFGEIRQRPSSDTFIFF